MLGSRTSLFVKERVGFLRLTDVYDLLDPESQSPLGEARDEPHPAAKWSRLVVNKSLLPTTVNVYLGSNPAPALCVRKRGALLRGRLEVLDASGQPLARLTSRLLTIGGAFDVTDPTGRPLADVKGDWKGWNFSVTRADGRPFGVITKKWAGLAKEVFTNADQYLVALDPASYAQPRALEVLLGTALAIDLIFKEQQ